MNCTLPSDFVPLMVAPPLPLNSPPFTDDWSTWCLREESPRAMTWSAHPLVAANAEYRFVSNDGGIPFFWAPILTFFVVFAALVWYFASSPELRPPTPVCCLRCCAASHWNTVESMLASASKVMDVCKIVSVLYIFLSAQSLTSMVCETPAVLLSQDGWSVLSTIPSWQSGLQIGASHYMRLGYSLAQYRAVIALLSASPDYRYFYSLYAAELATLAIVVCSWSAVEKHHWTPLYGMLSLMLAIAWGVYGTQEQMEITLFDSTDSNCGPDVIYCIVPYLTLITRSFATLHLVIAGYYLGLAGGTIFGCRWCMRANKNRLVTASPLIAIQTEPSRDTEEALFAARRLVTQLESMLSGAGKEGQAQGQTNPLANTALTQESDINQW